MFFIKSNNKRNMNNGKQFRHLMGWKWNKCRNDVAHFVIIICFRRWKIFKINMFNKFWHVKTGSNAKTWLHFNRCSEVSSYMPVNSFHLILNKIRCWTNDALLIARCTSKRQCLFVCPSTGMQGPKNKATTPRSSLLLENCTYDPRSQATSCRANVSDREDGKCTHHLF